MVSNDRTTAEQTSAHIPPAPVEDMAARRRPQPEQEAELAAAPSPPMERPAKTRARARAREERRAAWRQATWIAARDGRPAALIYRELSAASTAEIAAWQSLDAERALAQATGARQELDAILRRLPRRLLPVELGGDWQMPEDREQILRQLIDELGDGDGSYPTY